MQKHTGLFLFLLLASCGYRKVDTLQFGSDTFRCTEDGLCLHATGDKSLQVGFRCGAAEIRVDVLDAQTQLKSSPQNFAVRVIDQHLNPLMLSDNGRMPKSWDVRHQDSHFVKNYAEFCIEAPMREDLIAKMAASLKKRGGARDIQRQEAYELALQIIEDMEEVNAKLRSGTTDTTLERWKKPKAPETGMLLLPRESPALINFNYGMHDLHEALALASLTSVGRDDFAHRELQQQLQPNVSGQMLDGDTRDMSELVHINLTEFHQTVHLWKKLAPAIMRIFPFEGAEHSATVIDLQSRSALTGYAWLSTAAVRTRNHGTEAEAATMQHYATCDMYPTTFGHYAWKGECAGRWGFHHLCNDDTALQLYHAAGNWTGGRHCPLTHRKHAPYCDAVWGPNGERVFSPIKWGWF